VKLRKGLGLFAGLAISAGLLAFTPAGALAADGYTTYDGGSPASCPGTYSVWASNTMTPSGVTGYIKVELAYCPAWQVAWTRAYNYTSRSSVLLATGLQRTSMDTAHNRSEDYLDGSCDSFCVDWVSYGTRSYGRQLYIPSNFSSLAGGLKSTVYYCINSSCSSHQTLTVGWPNLQTKIANLAHAQLGKTDCTPFVFAGSSSCGNAWCAIFAGWVWANSGVNTTGLGETPHTFETYGPVNNAPNVGDVVLFYQTSPTGSYIGHVAIVYSVSNGVVTSIAGNEGPTPGVVGLRTFSAAVGSQSTYPNGFTYTVHGYVSPKT
jgi:surface antigen